MSRWRNTLLFRAGCICRDEEILCCFELTMHAEVKKCFVISS